MRYTDRRNTLYANSQADEASDNLYICWVFKQASSAAVRLCVSLYVCVMALTDGCWSDPLELIALKRWHRESWRISLLLLYLL